MLGRPEVPIVQVVLDIGYDPHGRLVGAEMTGLVLLTPHKGADMTGVQGQHPPPMW